jgi:hypothetical protein
LVSAAVFAALLLRHYLGQRRGQCSLAVINVTDCAHVYVGFGSFKFFF